MRKSWIFSDERVRAEKICLALKFWLEGIRFGLKQKKKSCSRIYLVSNCLYLFLQNGKKWNYDMFLGKGIIIWKTKTEFLCWADGNFSSILKSASSPYLHSKLRCYVLKSEIHNFEFLFSKNWLLRLSFLLPSLLFLCINVVQIDIKFFIQHF